jgi:hypothetical protein
MGDMWPVRADPFVAVHEAFFAGDVDALMHRQRRPGAQVWEVWSAADAPMALAQRHDWASHPLPTPGAIVVNITPELAGMAASIASGIEDVHSSLEELPLGMCFWPETQYVRLGASSRPHAFRVLAPLFARLLQRGGRSADGEQSHSAGRGSPMAEPR